MFLEQTQQLLLDIVSGVHFCLYAFYRSDLSLVLYWTLQSVDREIKYLPSTAYVIDKFGHSEGLNWFDAKDIFRRKTHV